MRITGKSAVATLNYCFAHGKAATEKSNSSTFSVALFSMREPIRPAGNLSECPRRKPDLSAAFSIHECINENMTHNHLAIFDQAHVVGLDVNVMLNHAF